MPPSDSPACAAVLALVSLLGLAGCGRSTPPAAASLTLTAVPPAGPGGSTRVAPVGGRAAGARPGDRVVVYARSGVWWVQPFAAEPFTALAADGTWQTTTHLGTEYAALLVSPEHRPASTLDTLPEPGDSVRAVITARGTGDFVTRPPPTVSFSGYDWEVRDASSDRGGANYYDARNVEVDAAGRLHVRLTQRDGRWTGAEVSLVRGLGYGSYVFTIADVSHLPPAAVLGLLTWDDGAADENHREMDVEISRWGDPSIDNAQYVVQPYYIPANVRRFTAPAGRLVHTLRWEPGRASFRTDQAGAGGVMRLVTSHVFTTGVPAPGDERIRVHLYPFSYATTPVHAPVEVVVEKFQYLP
jgi:hypothetical protein